MSQTARHTLNKHSLLHGKPCRVASACAAACTTNEQELVCCRPKAACRQGIRRACAPLYTRGWLLAYEPGTLPPGAGAPAAGSVAGPCAEACSALPGAPGSSGPAGGSSGPVGRAGAPAAAAGPAGAGAGAEGREYEETGSRSDALDEGTATGAAGSGVSAAGAPAPSHAQCPVSCGSGRECRHVPVSSRSCAGLVDGHTAHNSAQVGPWDQQGAGNTP
jgi:hypothetical protein